MKKYPRARRLARLVSSGSDNGEIRSFGLESYSVSMASKPPLTGRRDGFFPSFFQSLTGSPPLAAGAGKPVLEPSADLASDDEKA